jgi:hypothetical protein
MQVLVPTCDAIYLCATRVIGVELIARALREFVTRCLLVVAEDKACAWMQTHHISTFSIPTIHLRPNPCHLQAFTSMMSDK